jgi:hypothetical protein
MEDMEARGYYVPNYSFFLIMLKGLFTEEV